MELNIKKIELYNSNNKNRIHFIYFVKCVSILR